MVKKMKNLQICWSRTKKKRI